MTSAGSGLAEPLLPQYPHVRHHEWRHRGYVKAKLTPSRVRADSVAMESVADLMAKGRALGSFVVEDGKAGAVTAE
jgi:phosphodiesterase/alkaline phosphatase D-like protein